MKFSDEVKEAATGSVYDTMKSLGIDRFEVVGLGGDDIFVIVSGKVALKFATGLIKEYNNKFKKQNVAENENMYESTMSVGVCNCQKQYSASHYALKWRKTSLQMRKNWLN